jgi:hypothetical protein
VIGQDITDYAYLATGDAAIAAEYACSYVEALGHAARNAALAAAYLKCKREDPLPQPDAAEQRYQADLLRDIFGNPFRPVAVDPAWRTSAVVALATGIYDERAFDRMPILADALEDAGCDNDDILDHCRGPNPHVRGCWVVDLPLGKS